MRILVISSVPPTRCGIATYASQQIARLKEEGHAVTVAALDGEGVADLHFRLKQVAEIIRLTRLVEHYDRTILHYQHDFFFSGWDKRQLISHNLLLAELFGRGVEVVAHEVSYRLLEGGGGRLVQRSERYKWRSAKQITVHTPPEEARLRALVPGANIVRRDHQADFRPFRQADQAAVRAELDIQVDAVVYLCIGFIQHHKGFDRAMTAFAAVTNPRARLYVVGSARVEHPEIRAHIQELRRLAALDKRIVLLERFVSDSEFASWLTAADVVVLPYREIWSSSVVARAKLFGRRVVATAVGGLGDQIGPDDTLVGPDDDLGEALVQALATRRRSRARRDQLRIAVVPPWYAPDRPAGGERVVRETAERLQAAGAQVEVFTTRIRDFFSDWSQNARGAEERVGPIAVHRFPVEARQADLYNALAERVRDGESLREAESATFFGEMLRSPALAKAVAERRLDFDLFLLPHYMFATTVEAARAVGDRAVLMPFLHDEGYARLPAYGEMFRRARGGLYLSAPEATLAQRLYGLAEDRCAVVGTGVELPRAASRFVFQRRHGVGPYLVYVGRKESGKNFPQLLQWFRAVRDRFPGLRLVTIGAGQVALLPNDGQSICDLGQGSERTKLDTLAGALALVQPSLLESFSLSLMESWSVGRPVFAHADCAVTRFHVEAAGGGLLARDAEGFALAVKRLLGGAALAARLGRNGKAYVQRELSWPTVMARTLAALERFRDSPLRSRDAA